MSIQSSAKHLSIVIFATLLLTACGGGSDSSSSPAPNDVSSPLASDVIIQDPPASSSDQDKQQADEPIIESSAKPDNELTAALNADNIISQARMNCGLNGLTKDAQLDKIAVRHANYIKYVFAKATPTRFNAHIENKIDDITSVTGNNNPFFGGSSFANRLSNAQYVSVGRATENIAQTLYFSSAGNFVAPEVAARAMTRSLLAAPYHLRSLMLPSSALIGTGVVTYKPFNKDQSTYQGNILVTHAADTQKTKNITFEKVFTYPCEGVTDTVTALYNESPDPFNGTRNLRDNPIGQPVYINMPTANTIKVSNIKFLDVKRGINIPVELLDSDSDPYKNTNASHKLPNNEAFILPLTDNLKSCEKGQKQGGNCGLFGNSQYEVSFDILVDNAIFTTKRFTFTTGNTSY